MGVGLQRSQSGAEAQSVRSGTPNSQSGAEGLSVGSGTPKQSVRSGGAVSWEWDSKAVSPEQRGCQLGVGLQAVNPEERISQLGLGLQSSQSGAEG